MELVSNGNNTPKPIRSKSNCYVNITNIGVIHYQFVHMMA